MRGAPNIQSQLLGGRGRRVRSLGHAQLRSHNHLSETTLTLHLLFVCFFKSHKEVCPLPGSLSNIYFFGTSEGRITDQVTIITFGLQYSTTQGVAITILPLHPRGTVYDINCSSFFKKSIITFH